MKITVIKQNPEGQETWRYTSTVLLRGKSYLVLEAFFDRLLWSSMECGCAEKIVLLNPTILTAGTIFSNS